MSRRPGRARSLLVMLVVAVSGSSVLFPGLTMAGGGDRLPDLRMLAPDSFEVCAAPTGGTFQTENRPQETDGDRWLRFDSVLMNVGEGTFRVIARRASTAEDHMRTTQWIRRADGSWRKEPTDATLAWAEEEDGHPHWHTQGMERYRLFRLPTRFEGGAKVGVKRGYCFFDGVFVRPDIRFARSSPVYSFFDCGQPGRSLDALYLRVGLSVGWGDEYPWNYAGQRIDVTDVAEGEYLLCLTADPTNDFEELRDDNNESWARISLTTVTSPAFRVDVEVLAQGRSACQTQVTYPIKALGTG